MTNPTQLGNEIARKLHAVTERAVMKNDAQPQDIFQALETVFVYWMAFLNDSDRAECAREFQQRVPEMLKLANGFSAAVESSSGVPNFHRH
jgi:hypothetical protein